MKIGIVGSAFELTEEERKIARELGKELSRISHLEFFICFDPDSLPMETAKSLIGESKKVTCFVCDDEEGKKAVEIGCNIINVGLPRMFREIIFIKNVDGIIVCGGGSGTLMEVAFAYQLNKKVFLLEEIESIVAPFKEKFLDKRERVKIRSLKLEEGCFREVFKSD